MSKPVDDNLQADLSAYLDDELSPERRAAVEAWLAAAPEAQAELRALRRVKTQVATLPRAAAPAELARSVLAKAAEHLPAQPPSPENERRRTQRRWVRLTLRVSSAAAVLMLGAFLGAYWQAHLQHGFSGPVAATQERLMELPAAPRPPGAPALADQDAALSVVQDESPNYAQPQEAARQLAAEVEPSAPERNEKKAVPSSGTIDVFFTSSARDARLEQLSADAKGATSGVAGGADPAVGTRDRDVAVALQQPERGVPNATEPDSALHRARGQAPTPGRSDTPQIAAGAALSGSTNGFYAYRHGGAALMPQVALVVPTTSLERYAATAEALSQWAFTPSADLGLDRTASVATAAGVLRVNLAVPRSEVGERLGQLMALNAGAPLQISTHFQADDSVLAWDVATALTRSTQWKTDADGHDFYTPAYARAKALTAPPPRAPSARADAARTAQPATSEGVEAAARSIREAAPGGAVGTPREPEAERRAVPGAAAPPPTATGNRPAADTPAAGVALTAPQFGPPAPSSQPALVQMEVILVPPPTPAPATAPASAPTTAPAPPHATAPAPPQQ